MSQLGKIVGCVLLLLVCMVPSSTMKASPCGLGEVFRSVPDQGPLAFVSKCVLFLLEMGDLASTFWGRPYSLGLH